jgi:5'-nucleotidase
MKQKPLILVTNDDGVTARGIRALVEFMREIGDVIVVAPDKGMSGMGHAITINSTLRLLEMRKEEGFLQYSCSGTPVDCVKFGVKVVSPNRKIDLLVSGINHGSNSSINVIYSGTMSAAIEGAIEGIPAIGFSLCSHNIDADFSPYKEYVQLLAKKVLEKNLPKGMCLNVNIPCLPKVEIKGMKVCRQANAYWDELFDERKDPFNNSYYWLTGQFVNLDNGADTDEEALKNGYISIVPTKFDLTAHEFRKELEDWISTSK